MVSPSGYQERDLGEQREPIKGLRLSGAIQATGLSTDEDIRVLEVRSKHDPQGMRYVTIALGISSTLLVQLVVGMGQIVELKVCIQQALHTCLCLPHLSQEVTTLGNLPCVRLMLPKASIDIVKFLPQHL